MRRFTALMMSCALLAAMLAAPGVARAEAELRSVAAWSKSFRLVEGWFAFMDHINKTGKGIVQIKYLGGPEVTPSREQGQAVRSGFVDITYSPPSYYLGLVPEGDAVIGRRKSPMEIRENGGLDMLKEIWAKKLNAYPLGLFDGGTRYHLYVTRTPPLTPDGLPNFKGFKMRVSGTYRAMVRELGATSVSISPREVYNAMERGLVDGLGWPQIDFMALKVTKFAKYKIEPPILYMTIIPSVNLDKWKSLPQSARDFLDKTAAEWEQRSFIASEELVKKEAGEMAAAGVKPFTIPASAAERYQNLATKAVWDRFEKRMPNEAAALKPKVY